LGCHKAAGAREAIEARGASLTLLPPYSHDRNPIEQVVAKLKALLRKVAPRTCTADTETLGEMSPWSVNLIRTAAVPNSDTADEFHTVEAFAEIERATGRKSNRMPGTSAATAAATPRGGATIS
jgi:hypothetical protein